MLTVSSFGQLIYSLVLVEAPLEDSLDLALASLPSLAEVHVPRGASGATSPRLKLLSPLQSSPLFLDCFDCFDFFVIAFAIFKSYCCFYCFSHLSDVAAQQVQSGTRKWFSRSRESPIYMPAAPLTLSFLHAWSTSFCSLLSTFTAVASVDFFFFRPPLFSTIF